MCDVAFTSESLLHGCWEEHCFTPLHRGVLLGNGSFWMGFSLNAPHRRAVIAPFPFGVREGLCSTPFTDSFGGAVLMNQWVGGEESPSARCARGFLASLNALQVDRDGFSARPQQQRLHAGSDNRRLPLPVCASARKIRVSDIHSTSLIGSRRPSGMPWIVHRWMLCY